MAATVARRSGRRLRRLPLAVSVRNMTGKATRAAEPENDGEKLRPMRGRGEGHQKERGQIADRQSGRDMQERDPEIFVKVQKCAKRAGKVIMVFIREVFDDASEVSQHDGPDDPFDESVTHLAQEREDNRPQMTAMTTTLGRDRRETP